MLLSEHLPIIFGNLDLPDLRRTFFVDTTWSAETLREVQHRKQIELIVEYVKEHLDAAYRKSAQIDLKQPHLTFSVEFDQDCLLAFLHLPNVAGQNFHRIRTYKFNMIIYPFQNPVFSVELAGPPRIQTTLQKALTLLNARVQEAKAEVSKGWLTKFSETASDSGQS